MAQRMVQVAKSDRANVRYKSPSTWDRSMRKHRAGRIRYRSPTTQVASVALSTADLVDRATTTAESWSAQFERCQIRSSRASPRHRRRVEQIPFCRAGSCGSNYRSDHELLNNKAALRHRSARGLGGDRSSADAVLGANVVINYTTGDSSQDHDRRRHRTGGTGTVLAVQANIASHRRRRPAVDATLAAVARWTSSSSTPASKLDRPTRCSTSAERYFDGSTRSTPRRLRPSSVPLQARRRQRTYHLHRLEQHARSRSRMGVLERLQQESAGQFPVEGCPRRIGARGVTVDSILPTATDGAGVFTGGDRRTWSRFIQSIRRSSAWEPSTTSPTPPNTSPATSRLRQRPAPPHRRRVPGMTRHSASVRGRSRS